MATIPDVTDNELLKGAALWERHLVFGTYPISTVLTEVKNDKWQVVRLSMLGTSLAYKWESLTRYLNDCGSDFHSRCVVTNYVHALKRGGVIK